MTKRTSAKYKIDRRMGENIWGRPKSPVNRREYGPGQHGQRRKGKMSDFGLQLRAKQKLKGYYGDLTEKQFRRIYAEAERVQVHDRLVTLRKKLVDGLTDRIPEIFINGAPERTFPSTVSASVSSNVMSRVLVMSYLLCVWLPMGPVHAEGATRFHHRLRSAKHATPPEGIRLSISGQVRVLAAGAQRPDTRE